MEHPHDHTVSLDDTDHSLEEAALEQMMATFTDFPEPLHLLNGAIQPNLPSASLTTPPIDVDGPYTHLPLGEHNFDRLSPNIPNASMHEAANRDSIPWALGHPFPMSSGSGDINHTFQWDQMANSLSAPKASAIRSVGANTTQAVSKTAARKAAAYTHIRGMGRRSYRGVAASAAPSRAKRIKVGTPDSQDKISVENQATSRPGRDRAQKFELEDVLTLLEQSIQPLSTFSQNKANDLINQFKQLLVEEQKYGTPRHESSGFGLMNSSSSSLNATSTSEVMDTEYPTDDTSITSSAAHHYFDNSQDHTATVNVEPVHRRCSLCAVKPLLCCTKPTCSFATHVVADWKRHEEGSKHYPQYRYMCLECPVNASPNIIDSQCICEYCRLPLSSFINNPGEHYLQCASARENGITFSRKDHITEHLQKVHNIANNIQRRRIADTCKYPIDSKWPQQCGFCGTMFARWEERMEHIARHYQKGAQKSKWRLPRPIPKDKDILSLDLQSSPKDDDDSGDDDNFNGNKGYPTARAPGSQRPPRTPPRSQPSDAQSSWQQYHGQYSHREHGREHSYAAVHDSSQADVPQKASVALERYLNDSEDRLAARLTIGSLNGQKESIMLPCKRFCQMGPQVYLPRQVNVAYDVAAQSRFMPRRGGKTSSRRGWSTEGPSLDEGKSCSKSFGLPSVAKASLFDGEEIMCSQAHPDNDTYPARCQSRIDKLDRWRGFAVRNTALITPMTIPWFSRVWVVQEFVLSRVAGTLYFFCKEETPWQEFSEETTLLGEIKFASHQISEMLKTDQRCLEMAQNELHTDIDTSSTEDWDASTIVESPSTCSTSSVDFMTVGITLDDTYDLSYQKPAARLKIGGCVTFASFDVTTAAKCCRQKYDQARADRLQTVESYEVLEDDEDGVDCLAIPLTEVGGLSTWGIDFSKSAPRVSTKTKQRCVKSE